MLKPRRRPAFGEVEKLMQRGDLHPDLPALRAVGYRQARQFLRGDCAHAEFVAAALAATANWRNANLHGCVDGRISISICCGTCADAAN